LLELLQHVVALHEQTNLLLQSAHRRGLVLLAAADQLLLQSAQLLGVEGEQQIAHQDQQLMGVPEHHGDVLLGQVNVQCTFRVEEQAPAYLDVIIGLGKGSEPDDGQPWQSNDHIWVAVVNLFTGDVVKPDCSEIREYRLENYFID
jgi:hypothetical protein